MNIIKNNKDSYQFRESPCYGDPNTKVKKIKFKLDLILEE